jgi:membrane protein implicated in regulation of membrane protease activity
MNQRLKLALQYSFVSALLMTIVGYLLGSSFYWQGIIGFAIGGFVNGYFVHPYFERRKKSKAK